MRRSLILSGLLPALALAVSVSPAVAQCVSLTTLGGTYSQDFDTLSNVAGTTTNVLAINGWFLTESGGGTRDNEQYAVDTGSSGTGDTYSYGATASTDRALGGLQSGTLIPTFGACFTNNTGSTVSNLTIAYTGEEWRLGAAARSDQISFEYSTDATDLVTGTWNGVAALNFVTPDTVTTGAKNGNAAGERTALSSAISPLSIANGVTFWIRWTDLNASGADDGLTVDDFSLTPSVADVAPSVLATTPADGATGVPVATNLTVTFSEPVDAAAGWFTIACTSSGAHPGSTFSGGPTTFSIDPAGDLVLNESCAVTVNSAFVTDQDTNDPPDAMAADFNWSFDTNPPPALVINEIDYDQNGTDAAEFLEIRNDGATSVNLDPVTVELVNGNLGGAAVYQAIDLPNVSLAAGGYYVICAANTATPNCDLDVSPNTNLIQNGAPDAVGLRWNGVLVDAVSYEGDTGAPYTEGTGTGLVDDGTEDNQGISRFPDGADSNQNASDLSPRCITPGYANASAATGCPPPAILGLAIDDVTAAEGQSGTTTFSFHVHVDQPAGPGGVTFDIATTDGSAVSVSGDYDALSLAGQSIPAGGTDSFFDVTVNGDTAIESDETFVVNVTNVAGAAVGDPQAIGTIQNDDFTSITPIHDVQGNGVSSPIVGSPVTVHGIVTGVKASGFFVQEEEAGYDADPATSEGVSVFTGGPPPAAAQVGNLVWVTGTVAEFVPSADGFQPPLTEIDFPSVVLDAGGQPLPAPVVLTSTFPDPAGAFDQLERVEGMRVAVPSLTVTGPTLGNRAEPTDTATSTGVFFGTVTGVPRAFREPGIEPPDPAPSCCGTIPPIPRWDGNPEVLRVDGDGQTGASIADVGSGAVVTGLVGPLDYSFRRYTLLPDPASPPVISGGPTATPVSVPTGREVTVASFNMERFFDSVDDPGISEPVVSPAALDKRLGKASLAIRDYLHVPDVIGVEEMENLTTLQALAARISSDAAAASEPDPQYAAYLVEGNDIGGIDVGFLVKTAPVVGATPRVTVNAVVQESAATPFTNPDSSTVPLNDRPPLRLDAVVNHANGATFPLTVIVNHLRSLGSVNSESPGSNGWPTEGERVRTKRQKQAEDLANLVQARQTGNPSEHIVLLGDFNAFELNDGFGDSMHVIAGTPVPDDQTAVAGDGVDLVNPDLVNLYSTPPPGERYSYVFDGIAQTLDHVLANAPLLADVVAVREEHGRLDADFPETARNLGGTPLRLSDHDPVVAFLEVAGFATADLAVTKVDSPDPVNAGANLTYTLTVSNNGPDPAGNASWSDTLPAATTFVSLSAVAGWSCTTPAVGGTGAVSCSDASLAPGASVFTLTVAVDGNTTSGTVLTNTATVSSSTSDPNPGNGSATASTTVIAPAALGATKTAAGSFAPGGTVVYTVVVTNGGPGAQADNPGSEFTDVLPSGLTLVSAAATSGTAVATVATNTVTWDGALAAGASVTLTIDATITAGDGVTIVNQGTITFDADGDGTNESTAMTDDPGAPGGADPTSFVVGGGASVVDVPALDWRGLLALAALLAALGARGMRRD